VVLLYQMVHRDASAALQLSQEFPVENVSSLKVKGFVLGHESLSLPSTLVVNGFDLGARGSSQMLFVQISQSLSIVCSTRNVLFSVLSRIHLGYEFKKVFEF